jgi:hypothetical protein
MCNFGQALCSTRRRPKQPRKPLADLFCLCEFLLVCSPLLSVLLVMTIIIPIYSMNAGIDIAIFAGMWVGIISGIALSVYKKRKRLGDEPVPAPAPATPAPAAPAAEPVATAPAPAPVAPAPAPVAPPPAPVAPPPAPVAPPPAPVAPAPAPVAPRRVPPRMISLLHPARSALLPAPAPAPAPPELEMAPVVPPHQQIQVQDEYCPVCLERERNTAFISCGHLACAECAGRIEGISSQCPVCRQPFSGTMRVYS